MTAPALIVTEAGSLLVEDADGLRSATRAEVAAAYITLSQSAEQTARVAAAAEAVAAEIDARRRKWAAEPGSLPFPLATSLDKLQGIFNTANA